MVVMDKQGYMDKAKNLLEQPTYRTLPVGPTNRHKTKLINILKRLKKNQTWMALPIEECIKLEHVLLSCMVFQKSIKRTIHLGS